MKKIICILLLLSCFMMMCIAGCDSTSSGDNNENVIDKSVQKIEVDFDGNLTFELGEDIVIPIAKLVDDAGNKIESDVTYLFKKPSGEEISSIFPNLKCDEVGNWTVTYKYGEITLTKEFKVQDTIAPTIELTNIPADVFVDSEKQYSLPEDVESDLSDIDWANVKFDLKLDGEEVDFNKSTRKFKATKAGEFTYQITIQDIYGNATTSELVKWNAKIKDWKDENLPAGYLATYDSKEYINTVESGDFSDYWHAKPYESWLSEFEGATGVVRLQASPYGIYKCIGYKFNMQKILSADDMQGKFVVIKMYTTNNIDKVYFGGMKWIDLTECCENFPISIEKNCWQYLVISRSDLQRCYYFDEGEVGFNAFQLGFGMANTSPMVEDSDLYIDYVSIVERLEDVSGVTLAGNTLTWNNVESAISYTVKEDDIETIVNTNQYTVKDTNSVLTVRANGDYIHYCSSKNEIPYIDVSNYQADELAMFDAKGYEKAVVENTLPSRTAEKIETTYMESYDGRENVIKVSSFNNEVYGFGKGIGDFVIRLPKGCNEKMTVSLKIEKLSSEGLHFIIPNTEIGITATGFDVNSRDWQTVILDYKDVDVKDEIWIMLWKGDANDNSVIYFDSVYNGIKQDSGLTKLLNSLAENLEEDYLSDFSSTEYEKTACKNTIIYRDATTLTAEYLAEYDGAENVLKVTTTNNQASADGKTGIGDIILKLPVNVTKKLTIRFAVEKCDGVFVRFLVPHTETSVIREIDTTVKGWQTVELSYQGIEDKSEIDIMIQGGKAGEENIFYFDYVYEQVIIEKKYEGEDVAKSENNEKDPFGQDKEWVI